jgi:ABC-type glycerol-3-phosphate transport system substrate-binding protein
MGSYDNIEHAPDIVSLLFAQQGIDLNTITTSRDLESGALDFYASFAMGSQKVWDGDRENSLVAFSGGKLAIYFGYSWDVFTIQKLNKNLQFKIYPVPGNQNNKSTIASYWVEGASAKSPNQKEALEFMKYLAQKDTAQKFYTETAKVRAFGEPYARKDLRESLREEPLVYPFVSQLDEAKSSYFASDTYDGDTGINSMMNAAMQTAVNGILQGAAPASAAETLNNSVKQVFQKYALPQ